MVEYVKGQMFQIKEVQRVRISKNQQQKNEEEKNRVSVVSSIDLNIDHSRSAHCTLGMLRGSAALPPCLRTLFFNLILVYAKS